MHSVKMSKFKLVGFKGRDKLISKKSSPGKLTLLSNAGNCVSLGLNFLHTTYRFYSIKWNHEDDSN